MKKYNALLLLSFLIQVISTNYLYSQITPMPTSSHGENDIIFDATSQKYLFSYNGATIYSYYVGDGSFFYNSGATFNGIKAKASNGNWFWPSNVGGISAELSSIEKKPWEDSINYKRLNYSLSNNTVIADWRMSYKNDYIDYTYKIRISDRTLIIDVEAKNGSTKATGFEFDRCENANNPRNIKIPYLTLFNLLYSDDGYTSMFVDWEVTNASTIYPFDPGEYVVPISNKSIRYTQKIKYYKKTDGKRNPLKERIYLTVSANIDEVLPNLAGPVAAYKNQAASRTVLSYGPPYPWLLWPSNGYNYKFLDSIKNRGVNDLNVIIKQYQYYGFDRKLPDVLNELNEPDKFVLYNCDKDKAGGNGGRNSLKILRNHIVNTLGYGFALHEQYVDYYTNSPTYLNPIYGYHYEANNSFDEGGKPLTGWTDCQGNAAHIFKPSKTPDMLGIWSSKLKDFEPTWSYLDVHSAANPSDFVDYDSVTLGAGRFSYVLNQYRSLPAKLRNYYGNVPIQGEGGKGLILYAGYYDDLEARLLTADYNVYGYNAPLFVDFAIKKIKPKSALHGVGHCGSFFAPCIHKDCDNINVALGYDSLLIYIATEIAYGNSGLITKQNIKDHSIEQAVIENTHVLPLAQAIIDAQPVSILYGDSFQTASDYIKYHKGYADINSSEFMGKIKITYDNGVVVCVNRHPTQNWDVNIGTPNKWFSYHALVDNKDVLSAEQTNITQYTLPAKNGWVVYIPR